MVGHPKQVHCRIICAPYDELWASSDNGRERSAQFPIWRKGNGKMSPRCVQLDTDKIGTIRNYSSKGWLRHKDRVKSHITWCLTVQHAACQKSYARFRQFNLFPSSYKMPWAQSDIFSPFYRVPRSLLLPDVETGSSFKTFRFLKSRIQERPETG